MSEIDNDQNIDYQETNKEAEGCQIEMNIDPDKSRSKPTQNQAEILLDTKKPLDNLSLKNTIDNPNINNNDISVVETSLAERIYAIKTMQEENIDIKYGLLIGLIKVNQIDVKEIVDAVLHLV